MAPRGRPPGFDREQVLDQAVELFWSKGFADTSIADLCSATGLKPPSIYSAFGSKEGLFKQAVDRYASTSGSGIWGDLEATPTARDAVRHVLTATAMAYTRGGRSRGCMIVLAAPHDKGAHGTVSDYLRQRRARNRQQLVLRFERAVSDGELPSRQSCDHLAAYVATLQDGMSIQAQDGASQQALLAVVDAALAGWDGILEVLKVAQKDGKGEVSAPLPNS